MHGDAPISAHRARLERFKAKQAGKDWRGARTRAKRASGPPPFDGKLAYLLAWYRDMRGANQRGWHHEPVPFTEIVAYFVAYKIEWDAFDVDTLRGLDDVWRSCLPKQTGDKES